MDSLRKNSHQSNCPPPPRVSMPAPEFVTEEIAYKPRYQASNRISEDIFIPAKKVPDSPKKPYLKILKFIFLGLFFATLVTLILGATFFIYKLNNITQKINPDANPETTKPLLGTLSDITTNLTSEERLALKGESEGRINILLLGIAGEGKPGGNLTDTIMIASIDTKNKRVSLLSLPRDLYVSVPSLEYSAKINSIYKYGLAKNKGIGPLQETIESLTNLSINYYLILNFSGFEKFINDIGGINILVERDIYDPTYPGPNYSYETFELKKGFHQLDGATALKYARERHDDPEGDFGRSKRQQYVIQAVKNKLFSTQTMLNPFAINNILNTLGNNIKTNITLEEVDSFVKLAKNLDTQNINNAVVDAWKEDSLLKVSHIFYENTRAFILIPRIGNYTEIQDLAEHIFDLKILEKRKNELKNENPRIALIDKTENPDTYKKMEKLIKNKMGFDNIEKLELPDDFSSDATTIFDLSQGEKPFSLDELIKKIPATLSSDNYSLSIKMKQAIVKYDLIIILGKDLNTIYHYDEDSIEDLQKYEATEEVERANE